ncbi:DUF3298 and DUF4163 domain-containing protein [Gelatiniphilus marinus]|uniref:DUF3298 domain-containing protein n=1 Tax=Gelatiniphilus marinus TaxID=1759464 RepID=A0ABW5JV67_9FLAO
MLKKRYLLIACFFWMLFSCENDVLITFSETNITSENNRIVDVNIPLASQNTSAAKSINSAIEGYVIKTLQIREPNVANLESVKGSIDSFNNEYTDFIAQFPESAHSWEAQIDGEVIFKTPDIICVSLTSYTNTGGAHGVLNISFLNFEAATGKLIDTPKLFIDIEGFKAIAKKHFEASVKDKDLLFSSDNFQLPKNIGYSDDGIILLYNTYEIAPHSAGIIEFSIPFEDAKSYLVFNSF